MESPTILEVLVRAKRVATISDARLRDLHRMLSAVTSGVTRIYPRVPAVGPLADEGVARAEHPVLFVAGRLVPESRDALCPGALEPVNNECPPGNAR